jgi:tyrosyl-tRNA synthetase
MAKVLTEPSVISCFLTRGVENVYPRREDVEKMLASGKRLRIYMGVDPTGPTLHLGHVIPLRKLVELQRMGHEVILLIGDFTAMIGDPTDKATTRKQLTRKEVMANCKRYKKQASRFLKFSGTNAAKLKFNSSWLGKMTFADVVDLASQFTVQQLSERDMFEKRLAEGKPVYMHEFLYPMMQGYDSVAMNVDMEIGGNDQTYNMLAGRDLLRALKRKEKFVLTTSLLADDTGKKMGKTEGNIVALSDSPEDMYGKVMSWTDGMILPGFRLCTDVADDDISQIEQRINAGENPMPFKRQLAQEIVGLLAGAKQAQAAHEAFHRVHQVGEMPTDIPTLRVTPGLMLTDALVASALVSSKTDARRQVEQGGVKIDGTVIRDPAALVRAGQVIQKGKRYFVKFV